MRGLRRRRGIAGGVLLLAAALVVVAWPRKADAPRVPTEIGTVEESTPPRSAGLGASGPAERDSSTAGSPPRSVQREAAPTEYTVEGVVRETRAKVGVAGVAVRFHLFDKGEETFREATTDSDGRFRFVEDAGKPRAAWFRVADPMWQLVRWEVEGYAGHWIPAEAGRTSKVAVWVTRVFRLRGIVVDEHGAPVAAAQVQFVFPATMDGSNGRMHFGMVTRATDDAGRFEAEGFSEDPGIESSLTVIDDRHAPLRLDPRSVPSQQRDDVRLVLSSGVTLAGVAVDAEGRPLSDAVVLADYGSGQEVFQRGTRTNSSGRFALKNLSSTAVTLRVQAYDDGAKGALPIENPFEDTDVRLVAAPLRFSKEPATARVLGLDLVDVDDEVRAAYDLESDAHVAVHALGPYAERGDWGHVERGHAIRLVGEEPVLSVRDFLERLLGEPKSPPQPFPTVSVRSVVFEFHDETGRFRATVPLAMDDARRAEIRAVLERLKR